MKMIRLAATVLFLGSVHFSAASYTPTSQQCVAAVYSGIGSLNFVGDGYGLYYYSLCQNSLKVLSLYASAEAYCTNSELQHGIQYAETQCELYGETTLIPWTTLEQNLTKTAIEQYQVVDYDADVLTENFTAPVLISQSYFDLLYHTETAWDFEMWSHQTYGWASYGFWGGILVIGIVTNLLKALFRNSKWWGKASVQSSPQDRQPLDSFANIRNMVRTHLVLPSAFHDYHQQRFLGCSIPTRIEGLVVLSYWVVSIVLCCANYRLFEGNFYWPDTRAQLWRYLSDRTGILSYANLPIVWMFSGRNNIFLWATGWSFSTFNVFHKHVARIATLQAIVHSIGYTVQYYSEGEDYATALKEPWLYLGVVATICMSLIVFFSFSYFRIKVYDLFLLFHILASVTVIVGLFYHTSIFTHEYDPYLWPLVAIWSFDRFLRLIRLIYCNAYLALRKGTMQRTHADAKYDKATDTIRLEVSPLPLWINPQAGQNYFLYEPFSWRGYENHPFTLCSWERINRSEGLSNDDSALKFEFWIKPQSGWTNRLRNKCMRSVDHVASFPILLEGPYGSPHALWRFDRVLMIAGGSGIASMASYLNDFTRLSHTAGSETYNDRLRTHDVSLVWAHRSGEYMTKSVTEKLANGLANDNVQMFLYRTGHDSIMMDPHSSLSKGAEYGVAEVNNGTQVPDVMFGRPDVHKTIMDAAQTAFKSGETLGVIVCGPPEMMDSARGAAHAALLEGWTRLEYFEEAFSW